MTLGLPRQGRLPLGTGVKRRTWEPGSFGYAKSLGKELSGQSKPLGEGLEERHVNGLKHQ